MKHQFCIMGQVVSLDKTEDEVKTDIQAALDLVLKGLVLVDSYKETSGNSFELCIKRRFDVLTGTALRGCICSKDMTMLSGLIEDVFTINPREKPIVRILPAPTEKMFYSPAKEFENLWKQIIKIKANEDVKSIKVIPSIDEVNVVMKFK